MPIPLLPLPFTFPVVPIATITLQYCPNIKPIYFINELQPRGAGEFLRVAPLKVLDWPLSPKYQEVLKRMGYTPADLQEISLSAV
jgi:hypothetical protein